MLRVKLKSSMAGIGDDGVPFSHDRGAVIEVPKAEAERMIQRGVAELFKGKSE